jgi:hypothetical protein
MNADVRGSFSVNDRRSRHDAPHRFNLRIYPGCSALVSDHFDQAQCKPFEARLSCYVSSCNSEIGPAPVGARNRLSRSHRRGGAAPVPRRRQAGRRWSH